MKKIRWGDYVLLALSVILIYALVKKPDIAIGYMRSGLRLCAHRVIPSLFPFAVLSCLFVDTGGADLAGKLVGGIISRLFGIGRRSAFAVIVGMLGGFPVGAIAASKLYRRGEISLSELQRLLVISGIPGSAFLISAVGISIWSSHAFGVALYFIQIISAVVIGVVMKHLIPVEISEVCREEERREGGIALLCDCIGDCANSMLRICGFVLFFTSAVGTLCAVIEDFGMPPFFKILALGFFEMTGAVALTPQLNTVGAILAALFVGWSGLSVHFQILSLCRGIPVSYRRYFVAKAIQGALSALLAYLYIRFSGIRFSPSSAPVQLTVPSGVSAFLTGLFVIALLLPILRKKFL